MAMTMFLSSSQREREIATVIRMGFELLGVLLAIGIQGALTASDSTCFDPIPYETSQSNFQTTIVDIIDKNDISAWESQKYFYISLIINVFFLVGYLMVILFVKEDISEVYIY